MRLPSGNDLTYANVMATIGVFLALGGTSYAVARNSIGTPQLKNDAVVSAKVKDGSLTPGDFVGGVFPRGPRGEAGPAGQPGANGTTSSRLASRATASLSRNAGAQVDVVNMNGVAAGAYLIFFSGEATFRAAAGLYVVCDVRANGQSIAPVKGIVGDTYGGDHRLATMTSIDRTTPFDLSVSCYPDNSTVSFPGPPQIDDIRLAAVKIDRLTATTQ